jgi:hypothetical protein
MPLSRRKAALLIFFLFFRIMLSQGQFKDILTQRSRGFEENSGQINTKGDDTGEEAKFFTRQGNMTIYCYPGKLSFVLTSTIRPESDVSNTRAQRTAPSLPVKLSPQNRKFKIARTDMVFSGTNPYPKIIPGEEQTGLVNDYSVNFPTGITGIKTYKTLTYKGIYAGIDLILKISDNGLKYGFVVRPGSRVSDIRLLWKGADSIKISETGSITYTNALGQISEKAPYSFTASQTKVASRFVRNKNELHFEVGPYDTRQELTIDPLIRWSTYFVGNELEGANVNSLCKVAADTAGNVCMAYTTASSSRVATSGAYQTTLSGKVDAFLAKFDQKGSLLWGTYFGSGSMDGCEVAMDKQGNIFLAGQTKDLSGIATNGAYQTSNAGDWDAFLAKFSPAGKLLWSTYFGGKDFDYGLGLKLDDSGNPYLAGWTYSTTGLATTGAFQTSCSINIGSGFLAKFTTSGSLVWSTYYGATGQNEGLCVTTDHLGNVYLGGLTNGTGIATKGAYQTSYAGGSADAFLVQFDSTGARKWGTYFGDSGYDYALCLTSDLQNNIYMAGTTSSTANIASSGAHQTVYGGDLSDAFIAKFSNKGKLLWATYYGGASREIGADIATDSCDFVYMTGWTASNSGIATHDALFGTFANNRHAYLSKFNDTGTLVYGTYYISNGQETPFGIALDKKKNIFISGNADGSGLATSGAYQTNVNGTSDAFLAKFSQPKPLVSAGKPKLITCPGDSVAIGSKPIDGITYSWTSSPPGFKSAEAMPKVSPTTTTVYYLATFPFYDCPIYDTVKVTVNYNFVFLKVDKSDSICKGYAKNIGGAGTTGYNYSWTSKPAGFTSTNPNPLVSPNSDIIYFVKETNTLTDCIYIDTVKIKVNPLPKPVSLAPKVICEKVKVAIGYPGSGNDFYNWSSVPQGFLSIGSNPTVSPLVTTQYFLKETNIHGCSTVDSTTVKVNPVPHPKAGNNLAICAGDSVLLSYKNVAGDSFQWVSRPVGLAMNSDSFYVKPVMDSRFYLLETVKATGCQALDSFDIKVNSLPAANAGKNRSICQNDKTNIGGPAVSGNTYQWISHPSGFNALVAGPEVRPKASTTYIITETTAAGCHKTDSVTINVNPVPSDPHLRLHDSICQGSSATILFHPQKNNTFSWKSIPAGFSSTDSSFIVSPPISTKYILLQTTISDNCPRTDTINLVVFPLPVPKITGSKIICGIGISSFSSTAIAGHQYHWEAVGGIIEGSQNKPDISIRWPSLMSGKVKLTETGLFGCKNSDSIPVNVFQKPKAGFGFQNACAGTQVPFLDSSLFADTLVWDLGDGNISHQRNPVETYNQPITYLVTQYASTKNGCADTLSKTLTIYPLPAVKWIIIKDTGRSISYNVSDSINITYDWSFGDGKTSLRPSGNHYYQKSGIYPISLIVANKIGCRVQLDSNLSINFTYPYDSIFVFPNPFTDKLTIKYILAENAHVKIYLYDDIGRLIYNIRDEDQTPGIFTYTLDDGGQALCPAIYLLKFVINGKTTVIRVLKAS